MKAKCLIKFTAESLPPPPPLPSSSNSLELSKSSGQLARKMMMMMTDPKGLAVPGWVHFRTDEPSLLHAHHNMKSSIIF